MPRTSTLSREQELAAPRRMHALQGIFLSHFTFREVQDMQLLGARCVARSVARMGAANEPDE